MIIEYKARLVLRIIAAAMVCLFLAHDIAWADSFAQDLKSSTLSPQSRLKPFFEKNGLDFKNMAATIYVAGSLQKLLLDKEGVKDSDIVRLSRLFSGGEVSIEKDAGKDKFIETAGFTSTGREYKYTILNFKKENKRIKVIFIDRAKGELTEQERLEIGIKNDIDRHHLDCPGLEGVWFVSSTAAAMEAPPEAGGAIVRFEQDGDPKELVDNMRGVKEIRKNIDVPGVISELKKRIAASGIAEKDRRRMLAHLDKILADIAAGRFDFKEFDAVILEDKADAKKIRGWLLGFNTMSHLPDADVSPDDTDLQLDILQRLLTDKFKNPTIGLSTQVLDRIIGRADEKAAKSLLSEYIFHELFCPVYGHYETRYIQEALFSENYENIKGDRRDAHKDGRLADILKKIKYNYRPAQQKGEATLRDGADALYAQKLLTDLASEDIKTRYDAARELDCMIKDGKFRKAVMSRWARHHGVFKYALTSLTNIHTEGMEREDQKETAAYYRKLLLKGPDVMRAVIRSYCDTNGLPLPEGIDEANAMTLRGLIQNYIMPDVCGSLLGDFAFYFEKSKEYSVADLCVWPKLDDPKFGVIVPQLAGWFVSDRSNALPEGYFDLGMRTCDVLKKHAKTAQSVTAKMRAERLWTLNEVLQEIIATPPADSAPKKKGLFSKKEPSPPKEPDLFSPPKDMTKVSTRAEAGKIHEENLKLTPAAQEKTIVCHIITDSILPAGQRAMLKSLEQSMRDAKYGEKVVALSAGESPTAEEFISKLDAIKKREEERYQGYTVRFDVACSRQDFVGAIQEKGMKALAFEREGDGDIVQVEGIILALRALSTDDMSSLLDAYRFLTGKEPSVTAVGVKELARKILFVLPVRKVDINEIGKLNRIIEENIRTAA